MDEPKKEIVKALSLVSKLAAVMGEVERVAKHGRNEFHKYDYATESDITSAVRLGMASRNLMLVPSVEKTEWREVPGKSGPQRVVTLTVRFTVMDGDSGEKLELVILGEGQDQSDKATFKAMTGAVKYCLLKLFLIPTGDDPEADEAPKPAPPPRAAPRQEAARTVRTPPVNLMAAARANRIWHGAQAAGMTRDTFGAWVATVLGVQIASNLWTEAQTKQLEDELTQVTAEAKATQPAPAAAPAPAIAVRTETYPAAPPRASPVVRFGRDKGRALAEVEDLSWLHGKAKEDVAKNDPRWHAKNLEWLAAIDAELQYRREDDAPF